MTTGARPSGSVHRDFTVAVFVVCGGRTLLLYHKKHGMWLPPGGHIEPGETPDEAAIREVREETGLEVKLVGERGLCIERPKQLVTPEGIQLETIGRPEDRHEHIDLIYYAAPQVDGVEAQRGTEPPHLVISSESEAAVWVSIDELNNLPGVSDQVGLGLRGTATPLNLQSPSIADGGSLELAEDVRLWCVKAIKAVAARLGAGTRVR